MKVHILFFVMVISGVLNALSQTTANDGDWKKRSVSLKNTPEAEFMIRTGDIDNLGFQFPEGFDPFCGKATDAHAYPWDPDPADAPGTDRILLPTSYAPEKEIPCGGDGYSGSYGVLNTKPEDISIPLDILKGAEIRNAYLQLFIDDFQSPVFCTKFRMTLNGKRFVEAEKLLNVISQTGPVGKLITFAIPEEFYPLFKEPALKIFIDDPVTGAGDGYAIDFAKLIINRNTTAICKGAIHGIVLDNETEQPVYGAIVENSDKGTATTDKDGRFEMKDIPTGLEIVQATAVGYNNGTGVADVAKDEEGEEVMIRLTRSNKKASFEGKFLKEGESMVIENILFDQGSANLKPGSFDELNKIISFLQSNPTAEIELAGHTSSEGDISLNKSLSYKRVKSCKDYIVSKGIAIDRIISVGYGPDRPIAPNSTEAGRILNRRVEMRILKL